VPANLMTQRSMLINISLELKWECFIDFTGILYHNMLI
jgi:hypothetical protein